jgi:hypothetical protein
LLRAHKKVHFFVPRFSVYSPASSTADQPRFPTLLRRAHDNGSVFTLFFLAAGSRRCAFPTLAARLQESFLLFQLLSRSSIDTPAPLVWPRAFPSPRTCAVRCRCRGCWKSL